MYVTRTQSNELYCVSADMLYTGHRVTGLEYLVFTRARASWLAIARISYDNSVRQPVCPSVTTRYRFKTW